MTAEGFTGKVLIYQDFLEIDRSGYKLANIMGQIGLNRIYYSDISSVIFNIPGIFTDGIFDVKIKTGDTSGNLIGGLIPNRIVFKKKRSDEWKKAYDLVLEKMDNARKPIVQGTSLEKAVELYQQGLLTEDEFVKLKKKIIED